jgi:hypothetical protein
MPSRTDLLRLHRAPPEAKRRFNLAVDLFKLSGEVGTAHLDASLTAINDGPQLTLCICRQVSACKFDPSFDDLASPFGEAARVGVWHAQSSEKRAASA